MNTNFIIQNAKRESTKKDKGGYIILDWNSKSTPDFKVSSLGVYNENYTIHPGKNYYYVPHKNINLISLSFTPKEQKFTNSITFINFDLIDNLTMDYAFGSGCIYNFIDCKKITTNTPYIIAPQSNVRILCNNDAIINLYKEHSSYSPQYTTDTCLEALNCDLSKTTIILLYNTKYTDIYIGDCITTAKSISIDDTTSKTGIKRVHIDKYDKDNIKLNMDEWACKNIIIIDDSTKKKYKPIYDTNKTYFAEIVL